MERIARIISILLMTTEYGIGQIDYRVDDGVLKEVIVWSTNYSNFNQCDIIRHFGLFSMYMTCENDKVELHIF